MNVRQMCEQLIQNNVLGNNPIYQNAMKMMQSNDVNGLKNLAENICKEKGMSLEGIKKQLGI